MALTLVTCPWCGAGSELESSPVSGTHRCPRCRQTVVVAPSGSPQPVSTSDGPRCQPAWGEEPVNASSLILRQPTPMRFHLGRAWQGMWAVYRQAHLGMMALTGTYLLLFLGMYSAEHWAAALDPKAGLVLRLVNRLFLSPALFLGYIRGSVWAWIFRRPQLGALVEELGAGWEIPLLVKRAAFVLLLYSLPPLGATFCLYGLAQHLKWRLTPEFLGLLAVSVWLPFLCMAMPIVFFSFFFFGVGRRVPGEAVRCARQLVQGNRRGALACSLFLLAGFGGLIATILLLLGGQVEAFALALAATLFVFPVGVLLCLAAVLQAEGFSSCESRRRRLDASAEHVEEVAQGTHGATRSSVEH
jgi:hypothetical protein